MGFHDRTINRESHAHAASFGGEEGVELVNQPRRDLRSAAAPLSDRKSTFISGSQKVFEKVSEITWMASGAPLRNRRIP